MSVVTDAIFNANSHERYLNSKEFERIGRHVLSSEKRLRIAQILTENREKIIQQATQQLLQNHPVTNLGAVNFEDRVAAYRQSLDAYLRLITYTTVAGDEQIDLVSEQEIRDSIKLPHNAVAAGVRAMWDVALPLLPSQDIDEANRYFEAVIRVLQRSSSERPVQMSQMDFNQDNSDLTLAGTSQNSSAEEVQLTVFPSNASSMRSESLQEQNLSDREVDEFQVLSTLERRPLTVENLAYLLGKSVDYTRDLVKRLWNRGYIDAATGGIVRRMMLVAQFGRRTVRLSDSQTYFILTSKGHFRLHPPFSFGESRGLKR